MQACGGMWHSQCLKCTACGIVLNLRTFQSFENTPYCATHKPAPRHTQVSDSVSTKVAMSAPKGQTRVQGFDKTQRMTFAPGQVGGPPGRGGSPGRAPPGRGPNRGGPGPVRGPPGRGAPPNRGPGPQPIRASNTGGVNPSKQGPAFSQRVATPLATTGAGRNGPPPARNSPAPNRGSSPSSSPGYSRAQGQVVSPANTSASNTPFKPNVQHKTEVKALPTKDKNLNLGRQPLYWDKHDSDDEEDDSFGPAKSTNNKVPAKNIYFRGGGDQSTESTPAPRTIIYESNSSDQSTENNPNSSSITYEQRGFDQSTESNPDPSYITYEEPSYDQSTSYDNSGYDQGQDQQQDYSQQEQSYEQPSYDDQGGYDNQQYDNQATDQGSYDNQGYDDGNQGYDQGNQGYEDQGGYDNQVYDDADPGYYEEQVSSSGIPTPRAQQYDDEEQTEEWS